MPLMHGKSKKAFEHNVEAEMHAGKPQKQSLAIAYSIKRNARKKMSKGGKVGYADLGDQVMDNKSLDADDQDMEMSKKMMDVEQRLSKGGKVGYADLGDSTMDDTSLDADDQEKPMHKVSMEDDSRKAAMDEPTMDHDEDRHGLEMTEQKDPEDAIDLKTGRVKFSEGGRIDVMPEYEDMPKSRVDRIMQNRKRFADGGLVDTNARESKNVEDDLSFDALRKELYPEHEAMEELDYDVSHSPGVDSEEEHKRDKYGRVDRIRAKLRK